MGVAFRCIVLIRLYAPKQGYETVRIRSLDSDIFVTLLHLASKFDIKILIDTGSGNNRKLIDILICQRCMAKNCAQL